MKKIKYFNYLWYILKHKYYVTLECFKRGLYWRGLIHDWSKFLPKEFIPYARHFGGNIKEGRDKTGYYKPYDTGDAAFDFAWFQHQKINRHHWQWWLMPKDGDEKGFKVLPMSYKYRLEMLCDWFGAGRAQGTPDTRAWYLVNKDKLILHPETRKWIERQLKIKK